MRALFARSHFANNFGLSLAGGLGIAIALSAAAPASAQDVTVSRTYPSGTTVTTETRTIAPWAPPEMRTEVIPPAPNDMVVWHPGHWTWTGEQWAWAPGHYVGRPRELAMWQPGHWAPNAAGGYAWVEGHWD